MNKIINSDYNVNRLYNMNNINYDYNDFDYDNNISEIDYLNNDNVTNKDDDNIYIVKIIIIGKSAVGKTSLAEKFVLGKIETHEPTIGLEFFTKRITHINSNSKFKRKIKLQIWDTAGQEKFRSITKNYYRDAIGALICFSIANRESFEALYTYINDLNEYSSMNTIKIVVGTFKDLEYLRDKRPENMVSITEGEELAKKIGAKYIETSAITNENVKECFTILLNNITNLMDKGLYHPKKLEINRFPENELNGNKNYCCN